ncbi:phenazine biosynthesis FMN-dependent oxidase PhzG [Haloactinomyces albus]|uniref:Pyridoxamine 5'-phosphate oxidase n=1 Tax=Haloactinomyces albus TaxID=1352928 RepID=A0AAE4CKL6_9ACTN|nr:phenazine biosynthesis FMN-dependent oxidase PhzG [Haloactinomyces albus]MDR7301225.1 pyridoxamine 5'-phosphate oxidase [Haloactinomyces albus]
MAPNTHTLSGDTALVLPEFDTPPQEPHGLMHEWLESAVNRGVREPFAAVLATADSSGKASSRVLLVKEIDERGLLFTSFQGSRKGRDLASSPWASITFYWRESLQQLTAEGPVEILAAEDSDALFARRPLAAQATTAVSSQSRPLNDEPELRSRAEALVEAGQPVPRPTEWTGYRLVPHSIEFWYGSPDRLHRRLRYERSGDSSPWTHQRLQP